MARLTRFSLLSLPGSWSGPHRLWARRIPGEPGKFRTLAQVVVLGVNDSNLEPLLFSLRLGEQVKMELGSLSPQPADGVLAEGQPERTLR